MNNQFGLKKILSRFSKNEKIRYQKREQHPKRDWLIGLFFYFIFVLLGALYSSHEFLTYNSLSSDVVVPDQKNVSYNAAVVAHVLTTFDARLKAYNALQTSGITNMPVQTAIVASSSPQVTSKGMPKTAATSTGTAGIKVE